MLRVARARQLVLRRLLQPVGGQDELIFDGHSVVLDDEGERARAGARLRGGAARRRRRPATRGRRARLRDVAPPRARARPREPPAPVRRSSSTAPRAQHDRLAPAAGAAARRPRADAARARARAARLRAQERLRRRRDRPLRRDRLGARPRRSRSSALGAERVHGVSMPSRYSSEGTRGDARRLAESLGIDFREIAIEPMVEAFAAALAGVVRRARAGPDRGEPPGADPRHAADGALEQVRLAASIATGNKSELSVGYSTLYGDIAGGFALIKDVYKTDVFRLSRHLNERAGRELIPESIIERPPSAELRADQLDEDSLPPYAELDRVLEAYVEDDRSREELRRGRLRPGRRRARGRDDRPRRVQAPPGPARRASCARRPSGATGARRSRTAGGADASVPRRRARRPWNRGRILLVSRHAARRLLLPGGKPRTARTSWGASPRAPRRARLLEPSDVHAPRGRSIDERDARRDHRLRIRSSTWPHSTGRPGPRAAIAALECVRAPRTLPRATLAPACGTRSSRGCARLRLLDAGVDPAPAAAPPAAGRGRGRRGARPGHDGARARRARTSAAPSTPSAASRVVNRGAGSKRSTRTR